MAGQGRTIDVAAVIERARVGRFQIGTLALCIVIMLMDGFDVQAISYTAPVLKLAEPVTRAALAPVFSAGLFGLMLGALLVGYLADVIGRRLSLILCLVGFGTLSLATAQVDTIAALLVMRFASGLMLGGVMPNAVSLAAEYAPRGRRALASTMTICGFSAGAALGGILAGQLLETYSWRSVFYVGGVVPLGLAVIAAWRLPESARLLAVKGSQTLRLASLLARVDPSLRITAADRFVLAEEPQRGFPVGQLFANRRATATLLVWLAFFMNNVILYAVTNWLPIVLRDRGMPVSSAVTVTAMFQVGGTLGLLVVGWLADRTTPARVVTVCFAAAFVAIAAIGMAPGVVEVIGAIVLCAGFCVVGGQGGTIVIAAGLYPTAIRSTGVGWGLGAARLGGVFGPLAGAVLLGQQWAPGPLFLFAATPALVAAASIAAVRAISARRLQPSLTTQTLTGDEA